MAMHTSPASWAKIALAGLLVGMGCAEEPPRPPDIVLLVVDTLRADHLGSYGYERRTSPRIDAFAATATVWEDARSTSSWTLPSHASLFTGRFPLEHGARNVKLDRDGAVAGTVPLGKQLPTLAELMAEHGWRTAGFVANTGYLAPRFGLQRGFEEWNLRHQNAGQFVDPVLEWVDRPDPRPVFLFLNWMDTHTPYNTKTDGIVLDWPAPSARKSAPKDFQHQVLSGSPIDEEERARVIDQYDTAIANVDRAFAALLDGLAARGRLDGAIVIVTSDHGEAFGEHGLVLHGLDLYDATLRVPLIVRAPHQGEGRREPRPVSSVDLPAILLDAIPADMRPPADAFPYAPGNHPLIAEHAFAALRHLRAPWGARFRRERTALVLDGYKLIRTSDGTRELYDLRADPGETRDLADDQPQRLHELTERLDAQHWTRADPAAPPATPLPDEIRDQLEALGYL